MHHLAIFAWRSRCSLQGGGRREEGRQEDEICALHVCTICNHISVLPILLGAGRVVWMNTAALL
jgi:hypothetical protein